MENTHQNKQDLDLKVLVCQLNPRFKDIDYNIKRAEVSLSKYTDKNELDVVLFPEMAFTGYNFKSKEDIRPFLEESTKGTTFEFCSSLAKKLKSYVIVGYPELYFDETNEEHMYNSAYVIDREGNLILNYRKFYLYDTDKFWAKEGPSFQTIKLKNNKGIEYKAAIAICMDINPKDFKDPTEFKLAEFCKQEEIDVLFFLTAWLDDAPEKSGKEDIQKIINYWIYRLYLLLKSEEDKTRYTRRWAMFIADRVGKEDNDTFMGCSCAIKGNPLELVGCLDKKNEGFLLAEVKLL